MTNDKSVSERVAEANFSLKVLMSMAQDIPGKLGALDSLQLEALTAAQRGAAAMLEGRPGLEPALAISFNLWTLCTAEQTRRFHAAAAESAELERVFSLKPAETK